MQWAQKTSGDTPALQATIGLIYSRKGDLRRGINAVKRAYPQYLAAGGEELPPDVLEVLFPVAYWSLIQKYAPARGLDPYLIAALMAQESTFDADDPLARQRHRPDADRARHRASLRAGP